MPRGFSGKGKRALNEQRNPGLQSTNDDVRLAFESCLRNDNVGSYLKGDLLQKYIEFRHLQEKITNTPKGKIREFRLNQRNTLMQEMSKLDFVFAEVNDGLIQVSHRGIPEPAANVLYSFNDPRTGRPLRFPETQYGVVFDQARELDRERKEAFKS